MAQETGNVRFFKNKDISVGKKPELLSGNGNHINDSIYLAIRKKLLSYKITIRAKKTGALGAVLAALGGGVLAVGFFVPGRVAGIIMYFSWSSLCLSAIFLSVAFVLLLYRKILVNSSEKTVKENSTVKEINLDGREGLDDNFAIELSKMIKQDKFPKLKVLKLSSEKIKSKGVQAILSALTPKSKKGCDNINRHSELEVLELENTNANAQMLVTHLQELIKNNKHLQELYISSNDLDGELEEIHRKSLKKKHEKNSSQIKLTIETVVNTADIKENSQKQFVLEPAENDNKKILNLGEGSTRNKKQNEQNEQNEQTVSSDNNIGLQPN